MKHACAVLLALVFSVLPVGAAAAPVLHSTGYYINDYAAVVFETHRADILTLSRRLYDDTGIQVVVLTVDSLQGWQIDDYAAAVVEDWEIGGVDGKNGVLILVAVGEKESLVLAGPDALATYRPETVDMQAANLSKAIMNVYRPLVEAAFQAHGVTPDEAVQKLLENPTAQNTGPFSAGTVVFLAAVLLVTGRSFRVSRKYRSKYLKGNVRKPKTYTRSYDEEERYKDDSLYKIKYDGED